MAKKILRKNLFPIFILIALAGISAGVFLIHCGSGSGGGGGDVTTVVAVNTLDGQTGVATTLPFRYTFSGAVSAASVTAASYFIVPTPSAQASASAGLSKAAFNSAICDVNNALAATILTSSTYADLTPSTELAGNTGYTVCLTNAIQVGGSAFAGFMASFNSQGGGGGGGTTQTDRLRITNSCSYDIWIQQQNMPSSVPSVVKIAAGAFHDWAIADAGQASTRFWPKTGCDASGQNCAIGQSSNPCTNCPPPVDSKIEATWGCTLSDASACGTTPQGDKIGDTFWNMSAVDGYTLPFTTSISANTITDASAPCQAVDCSGLDFSQCPTDVDLSQGQGGAVDPAYANVNLKVQNSSGTQIGCYSPCKVLNYPTYGGYGLNEDSTQAVMYCCPTPPISSAECRAGPGATDAYVTAIHTMCNNSTYAYAYDDNYGLRHCSAGTLVHVTFGPNCP